MPLHRCRCWEHLRVPRRGEGLRGCQAFLGGAGTERKKAPETVACMRAAKRHTRTNIAICPTCGACARTCEDMHVSEPVRPPLLLDDTSYKHLETPVESLNGAYYTHTAEEKPYPLVYKPRRSNLTFKPRSISAERARPPSGSVKDDISREVIKLLRPTVVDT